MNHEPQSKLKTKEEIKKNILLLVTEYYRLFLHQKRDNIPVSGKYYDHDELMSVINAALDGIWTEGPITKAFEKKICNMIGVKYAITVNSGSSANLIAMKALCSPKLKKRALVPGDEVITVAAGFPTTINPIIQCNCVPVFCDVDIDSYNVNIAQVLAAISPKTKAIFLAHTLGNPFNLNAIIEICKKHNLWLIEDSCDALGSKYDNKFTGTFGDIGTFSLYPAHHITSAEGGIVVTNNDLLNQICRSIRDWGRDCWCTPGQNNSCNKRYSLQFNDLPEGYDHKYVYSEMGYNLKNTDLNMAIGLAQLDKLFDFREIRKKNFTLLLEEFKKYEEHFYLPNSESIADPSWFGFIITIKETSPINRKDLLIYLNQNKIDTRLLFGGNITKQPYFINYKVNYRIASNLKTTDLIMNNSFWVGICPLLDKDDMNTISQCIAQYINMYKKKSIADDDYL